MLKIIEVYRLIAKTRILINKWIDKRMKGRMDDWEKELIKGWRVESMNEEINKREEKLNEGTNMNE